MIRVGVLGSTRGSSMLPIVEAIKQHRLDAALSVVISNKQNALILQHAEKFGIPAAFVNPVGLSRESYDRQVSDLLRHYQVECVLLIGYMRILSSAFVADWQNRILNVHPSLLPAFAGGMDLAVHEAVLAAGVAETGCTVHIVTDEVDAGPIIVQKSCAVRQGDTAESLKLRVQALEGEALIEAVRVISIYC